MSVVPPPEAELTLERYATISAELTEGTVPPAELLAAHGLDEKRWAEATQHWMQAMADDALANGADARLPLAFSDAFSAAQDRLAAAPDMTPEAHAHLVVAIQKKGSPKQPLAERGLSLADFLRLSRKLARAYAADPALQQRFFTAFEKLQPR